MCSGRLWISTDPSTGISLRVHQRVTLGFRETDQGLRCCHIHISNPYQETMDDDVGFPTHMAQQSYEYLQEQVEQKRREAAQEMEFYQRLSYSDPLTGMFNRNRLNKKMDEWFQNRSTQLGVAYFDLNGLKEVNDQLGHSAGDTLLCRTATHLRKVFLGKAYRTGGDEFMVLEETGDEMTFRSSVALVEKAMKEDGISCAVGISWRDSGPDILEQFEEADQRMYQSKNDFYSAAGKNRRKRS